MSKPGFGKLVFLLILIAGLISACDEIQASQKYTLKGTSTKTPFHIKSTFTPTQEPPPTYTPSETPSESQHDGVTRKFYTVDFVR